MLNVDDVSKSAKEHKDQLMSCIRFNRDFYKVRLELYVQERIWLALKTGHCNEI